MCALFALAVTALLPAPSARAQSSGDPPDQWVLDHYACAGQSIYFYRGPGTDTWADIPGPNPASFYTMAVGWAIDSSTGLYDSSIDGTVTPVFRWTGPDPAPALTALVTASVGSSNGISTPDQVTASDGLGDAAQVTNDYISPDEDSVGATSSGHHLVRVEDPDGATTLALPPVHLSGAEAGQSAGQQNASLSAVYDKRSALLVPMGHEVTYHKGALIDPVTGMTFPGPELNKPTNDALQVDIGLPLHNDVEGNGDYSVSYKPGVCYDVYPNDSDNKGDTLDLTAPLKGQSESGTLPLFVGGDDPSAMTYDIPPLKVVYQMPSVYYNRKPWPYDSDYDLDHPQLDKGDAGSGDTVHLKYTFISDGVPADYTLNVKLHLPDENWQLDLTGENDTPPFEDAESDPPSQKAQFSVNVNYASIQNLMALGGESGSAGLTTISALCAEVPEAAACIAVLGYAADKAAPEPAAATMDDEFSNWSDAVNNGLVIGAPLSNYGSMTIDQQKTMWAQCTWTLKKRVPIKTYDWEAEHYTGLGYTGQIPAIVTQALNPVYYHQYTYTETLPTPPVNP